MNVPAARRDLVVLYVAMFVSRLAFGIIIIIFPLYIVHASDLATAAALALYPAFEAAFSYPMGRVCDTRGRKVVFVSALGYMAVLMSCIGLTRNIYAVASIHAAMGVGAAGVTISSLAMITDLTGERNRGAGMGAFDFANIGGYAFGILMGGRLDSAFADKLGVSFFVTGLTVAASFVLAILVLKEPLHEAGERQFLTNPLRSLDPESRALLPIWLGITTLIGVVFFLPRALATLGFTGSTTANLLFVGVTAIGLGSIGFGALSDSVGREKVMILGVVGLGGLLLSVGASFAEGIKDVTRNFPVIGIFAILTSALVPTILAKVGDRADKKSVGAAMGVYGILLSVGTAAGTLIAGFAHQAGGISGIFLAGGILFAGAAGISLVLWLRIDRSTTNGRAGT
ncbi:MAG TPA: MFS transporter [Nitrososphaerales archaeon]|nr:MFS transporter [Nitrososphaerales archaeon]